MSVAFNVRDFGHPVAILRLRTRLERSQWSFDAQMRYQNRLLRDTVEQAYHCVPYYQDLFRAHHLKPSDIRSADDLHKLPTLSKATLRAEFPRLQATNRSKYRPRACQTTGTSGAPLQFLLDTPANVLEFVYYWRHWSWAGYRLGSRFAELSSSFFVASESRTRTPFHEQRAFGRLLLNSVSLSAEMVAAQAAAIRRFRPQFLKGTASALYFFASFCKEQGVRDLLFRGIFSTGEVLLQAQRSLIEEVLAGKVYDSYGHMERTIAVSECPLGTLHVNSEYGLLELVDRQPVAPDVTGSSRVFRARVLGTSLHNRSMPLLRYEVGDTVEVDETPVPCRCGRALPQIRRVLGRQEDVVHTPDGRVIPTMYIVFDDIPGISLGQIVQPDRNTLVIRIVRASTYTAESEAQLLTAVRRFVGPVMRVNLEYATAGALLTPRVGKFRMIVSHLMDTQPAARAASAPFVHQDS